MRPSLGCKSERKILLIIGFYTCNLDRKTWPVSLMVKQWSLKPWMGFRSPHGPPITKYRQTIQFLTCVVNYKRPYALAHLRTVLSVALNMRPSSDQLFTSAISAAKYSRDGRSNLRLPTKVQASLQYNELRRFCLALVTSNDLLHVGQTTVMRSTRG